MSHHIKYLPLALFAIGSTSTFAETELDQVVVTASRTEQSVDQVLSSVSVITRADIERFNYQTLSEAINSLPGVSITNTGGIGKQTSLFLRGTESHHTQVLLNGVKLATNAFGAPQLEHVPLAQIERIELVRGPSSSLYGSGSIGGTIQIFTKKGDTELTPSLSVGFGSHNTKQTSLGLSGGNENNWFNLSGGYTETDGFSTTDSDLDRDGYDNTNSSVRAGHRFNNGLEIEAFSLRSEGTSFYDGYFNETEFMQHTYGASIDADISDIWSISASLSQGQMNSDNTGAADSTFDFETDNFIVQNDINVADNKLLTIGYEFENNKIKSSSNYDNNERDNHAIFSQLVGQYSTHSDYRIALRVDDNEQFGEHTTGNIAWGTSISDSLRFHTSYGTAFVAPSFSRLYFPGYSNPNLKPEESDSIEVGLSGVISNSTWSLNLYQTKIDNLIVSEAPSYLPYNVSQAQIRGLELVVSTKLFGINFDSQLSLLDPENQSHGANKGNDLARRAKQTFTLDAYKSFDKFTLGTKLFVSGTRYNDAANTNKLDGFATLDIVGSYKVNNVISLQLKAANLFDADYETVSGYRQDGANFLFSVNYQP